MAPNETDSFPKKIPKELQKSASSVSRCHNTNHLGVNAPRKLHPEKRAGFVASFFNIYLSNVRKRTQNHAVLD